MHCWSPDLTSFNLFYMIIVHYIYAHFIAIPPEPFIMIVLSFLYFISWIRCWLVGCGAMMWCGAASLQSSRKWNTRSTRSGHKILPTASKQAGKQTKKEWTELWWRWCWCSYGHQRVKGINVGSSVTTGAAGVMHGNPVLATHGRMWTEFFPLLMNRNLCARGPLRLKNHHFFQARNTQVIAQAKKLWTAGIGLGKHSVY